MSTINVQSITNGTDTIDVGDNVKGTAKAWVNFNGAGTVAIRDSFNVSSITDDGVGLYTLNFTNAMANANYCFSGSAVRPETTTTTINTVELPDNQSLSTSMTTTSLKINIAAVNSGTNRTNVDRQFISVTVFGS